MDWGRHIVADSIDTRPVGKALNISRALAWMGQDGIAAGLWGSGDYEQMLEALTDLKKFIKIRMTTVKGRTRRNITIVDTVKNKDMHLRDKSLLASKDSLERLESDLNGIVDSNSICVFAGSMPQGQLRGDVIRVINRCCRNGARIVFDSSGPALREIVDFGGLWLIKPNVAELGELLGRQVEDVAVSLAKAGSELLGKVDIVLISRGAKGTVAVTKNRKWAGSCVDVGREVFSTVGCGDYLLAGFLKGLKDESDADSAMETAIKVATAKAWGWTEQMSWSSVRGRIRVEVDEIG